jgi:hypothetical protein
MVKIAKHGEVFDLRTADVMDNTLEMIDALRDYSPRNRLPLGIYKDARRVLSASYIAKHGDDDAIELQQRVEDALQEFAPSYCYFGSNPGSGSSYGFWVDHGALQEFDGFREDDKHPVPDDYVGEVLYVNERGNTTLYVKNADGSTREIWAVV